MPRFSDFPRFLRPAVFLAIAAVILGAVFWTWHRHTEKLDALLDAPTLALQSLQAKTLYFNNAARPWLIAQRPDLLAPEDLDADSERTRALAQAVQNPKLFRQLDRKYRFDALLFAGDPSQSKPLLDHLVETKDWTLRYVDNSSLIFRRDAGRPWELADFAPIRARFAQKSASVRARMLAQTATKLLAVGQAEAAHQLLEEAAQLAPRNPEVATGLANYHLGRGEWREASEQVERALAADRNFVPALAAKTQLLYGTKNFAEAFVVSGEVIARLPQDPGLLFYHAKIAHEAHAYKVEIETLEKLVTWAEKEGRPVGGYQLYLGQAYASTGDAIRSVNSFMLALDDPDLPNDQRAFARENITRIKKRTGQ